MDDRLIELFKEIARLRELWDTTPPYDWEGDRRIEKEPERF